MHVYFDYQIFYLQRYGGISRYFYELNKELNLIESCEPSIIAPFQHNSYLEEAVNRRNIVNLNYIPEKLIHNRFYDKRLSLNEFLTKKIIESKKHALLHETYYSHRIKLDVPKVITIHDMIYELHHTNQTHELELIQQKKQAVLEADAIIAVSENTKKDLLELYPEAKDKTHVVYHGVDQSSHPNIQKYKHTKPFLLHVGNRGWYKNFEQLLEVYGKQKTVNEHVDLICFGGGEATMNELVLIRKYNLREKVHFISGQDNLLIALYKAAEAFVYISNYEGFGLPVLEAMVLSCPVLCSNSSSLPEVAGNAALSINPKDTEALIQGLTSILFDQGLRKNLVSLGLERAKEFTWKKCAEQTFEIYKTIL